MSMHEGRKSATEMAELKRVKEVYDDLRERDRVVTVKEANALYRVFN
jgi:hypothetical protein